MVEVDTRRTNGPARRSNGWRNRGLGIAVVMLGSLGLSGGLLGGCDSTPAAARRVPMDAQTPETLLASLQMAAEQSLNGYYEALLEATDCESLPEVCRLLVARRSAAEEMIQLRNTMVDRYGDPGRLAAGEMLRSAFFDQFDEIRRASVFTGSGDAAVLRIGTAVYRLRRANSTWSIVQFPDPPYDPAASADAIEILVKRVEGIRLDVEAGRIPSMTELDRRIKAAISG
ncbi:MAG: hypothetical protein CMJ23_06515 [Phycisphaerae bacterium]|nr:hypothetical protein [Phycisphaerae bacterium]